MENKKFLLNFFIVIIVSIAGLYLIKALNIYYPLQIISTTRSSELAVVGEGKIEAVPDTAYVDAGITVDNKSTVSEVQDAITTVNNKIISAMKNIGIEKADVKTSNYSISPNNTYENGQNRINGYNGNASIEIKVKDMTLVLKVIEEATNAGANQIQGSRFVVDKPETYREKARNAAIENAKDQAQKMAKELGIRLGKITNIVESSPNVLVPMEAKSLALSSDRVGGSASPVLEPGSQTITSVVTLYFEKQ